MPHVSFRPLIATATQHVLVASDPSATNSTYDVRNHQTVIALKTIQQKDGRAEFNSLFGRLSLGFGT